MDKFIISIADEKGLHQFHAHRHIKKIIFFSISGFIIIVTLSFWLLSILMKNIDEIALEQNIAVSEYKYLYQQNKNLKNQIQQKSNELSMIYQKIQDLESILSTQKNSKKVHQKRELGDIDALDSRLKTLLLNLLPNGNPVINFKSSEPSLSAEYPRRHQKLGYAYELFGYTPIIASADGVVEFVRTNYRRGYGNYIRLNHSFGFSSLYAHMDEILLKRGDFIKKGEVIGYANSKIYYEVSFLNKPIESKNYIQWSRDNFSAIFMDGKMDWGDLIYTISDILKLQNYGIQHDGKFSIDVIGEIIP